MASLSVRLCVWHTDDSWEFEKGNVIEILRNDLAERPVKPDLYLRGPPWSMRLTSPARTSAFPRIRSSWRNSCRPALAATPATRTRCTRSISRPRREPACRQPCPATVSHILNDTEFMAEMARQLDASIVQLA
ncbi:hypothetical protein [Methyloterricola oryzae]|uniref:hypothetical protein n=1 Tax=Methyloterricola oryzae TaxID=1495050 RepID=UPI0011AF5C15|nr:hypothetical protein [Methyloterricola oryzae]